MDVGLIVLLFIGIGVGGLIAYNKRTFKIPVYVRTPDREFPYQWREILEKRIEFYQRLDAAGRKKFEDKVHVFLLNVRVLGMQTKVSHEDKILVAASAVIPIFGFDNWHYFNLSEVHLHPSKFKIPGQKRYARGLIGWGEMDGIMKLSKKALHEGFQDQNDQRNVAIHEFIHVIDKLDGEVDGVLETLMNEIDIMPWMQLMQHEMKEIESGNSDIRKYGSANHAEFLAVVGEYFFESPEKMKIEHPALFNALDSMFNPKIIPKADRFKYTKKYDPCPCGSGRKFSRCCMGN